MAQPGKTIENPMTGERATFLKTAAETNGELLLIDYSQRPGGFVAFEHIHTRQEERFDIASGVAHVRYGHEVRVLRAGDSITIPAGIPHSVWNEGPGEMRLTWHMRPALETEIGIENLWGLARDGRSNRRGRPSPLQAALLMREFRDSYLPRPPIAVQRLGAALLAPLAKLLGYKGRYPQYSDPEDQLSEGSPGSLGKGDWALDRLFRREHAALRRFRRTMGALPRGVHCRLCNVPFGGVGKAFRISTGFAPSRKNPKFCNRCFEKAPIGGMEGDVGVLFADMRGFTGLAEFVPPEEAAALLNRFYVAAARTLIKHDAVIDKLVGDQVMALFIPTLVGRRPLDVMVSAAEQLLSAVGHGSADGAWLPLGIGLDFGPAFVGNVGSGAVKDFTAIGDVVNTAARLQAAASAGQILATERVYGAVRERWPTAVRIELRVKGRSRRIVARVIDVERERRTPPLMTAETG